jgi:hypothetical protein
MEYWQVQELMLTLGGLLIVLIPVTGLTLRFGLKPFLKDLAEIRAARQGRVGPAQRTEADRLTRIESQIDGLESAVRALTEVVQFDRQLKSPTREGDQAQP